ALGSPDWHVGCLAAIWLDPPDTQRANRLLFLSSLRRPPRIHRVLYRADPGRDLLVPIGSFLLLLLARRERAKISLVRRGGDLRGLGRSHTIGRLASCPADARLATHSPSPCRAVGTKANFRWAGSFLCDDPAVHPRL